MCTRSRSCMLGRQGAESLGDLCVAWPTARVQAPGLLPGSSGAEPAGTGRCRADRQHVPPHPRPRRLFLRESLAPGARLAIIDPGKGVPGKRRLWRCWAATERHGAGDAVRIVGVAETGGWGIAAVGGAIPDPVLAARSEAELPACYPATLRVCPGHSGHRHAPAPIDDRFNARMTRYEASWRTAQRRTS